MNDVYCSDGICTRSPLYVDIDVCSCIIVAQQTRRLSAYQRTSVFIRFGRRSNTIGKFGIIQIIRFFKREMENVVGGVKVEKPRQSVFPRYHTYRFTRKEKKKSISTTTVLKISYCVYCFYRIFRVY